MATILVKSPTDEKDLDFVNIIQSIFKDFDIPVFSFEEYQKIDQRETQIFIYDPNAEFQLPQYIGQMPNARTLYFTSAEIAKDLDTSELPNWVFIGKLNNVRDLDEIGSEYRRVTRNTHGWGGLINFK